MTIIKRIIWQIINYLLKLKWLYLKGKVIHRYSNEQITYSSEYFDVVNKSSIHIQYFDYLNTSFFFQSKTWQLSNVLVDHESGGVIKRMRLFPESLTGSWGYIEKSGIHKLLIASLLPSGKQGRVIENGFLLTGNMSYNFFHFLIDSLPRVLDYQILRKKSTDFKLIVNHKSTFAAQYLQLLGIEENDIVWIEQTVQVKHLIVSNSKYALSNPKSKWPNFIYSKSHLLHMAQLLQNSAEAPRNIDNYPERIYVSRSKAKSRFLLNENEAMETMSQYGILDICLEDLTVVEQIHLFSRAKVIVALHGAGLSNLIYTTNALIIEIFPANRKLSTLYQMHQLGQLGNNRHILYAIKDANEKQDVRLDLKDLSGLLSNEIPKFETEMHGN
jgi:hypothetical protein